MQTDALVRFLLLAFVQAKELAELLSTPASYNSETFLSAPIKYRLIMGNTAGDLDSTVSAISLAYATSVRNQAEGSTEVVIPLLNYPRADLVLRTDVAYWLEHFNLVNSSVIFFEDVFGSDPAAVSARIEAALELHAKGKFALTMVDHNVLAPEQHALCPTVDLIVDHHEDKGECPQAKRIIAGPPGGVGSCCTLVTDLVGEYLAGPVPADVSAFLLAPIVVDCMNFLEDLRDKRWIQRDLDTANALWSDCSSSSRVSEFKSRDELFSRLDDLKFDIEANLKMGAYNNLRKDYKDFRYPNGYAGVSSVVVPLDRWAEHEPDLCTTLLDWQNQHGSDVVVVMAIYKVPTLTRQVLLFNQNEALLNDLASFLSDASTDLRLSPISIPINMEKCPTAHIRVFNQGNVAASRKQMEPLLAKFFTSK